MSTPTTEFIVARERVHWGVFLMVLWPWVFIGLLHLLFRLEVRQVVAFPTEAPAFWDFVWPQIRMPLILVTCALLYVATSAWDTEYVLTNVRLRFRCGWHFRTLGELRIEQIESVFCREPLIGGFLGYGTVVVVGLAGTPFALRFVPRADAFYQRLKEAVDAVRTGQPLTPPPAPPANPPPPSPAGPPPSPSIPPPQSPSPPGHGPIWAAIHTPYRKSRRPRKRKERTLDEAWAEMTRPHPPPPPQEEDRYMPKE